MGFLILFLILILFVFPLLTEKGKVSRGTAVEVKGLDGSTLVFSEEGVSIFKEGEFRFFRKEEISELSVKKEDGSFKVKLRAGNETVEVPVSQSEAQKLFIKSGSEYIPAVSWLPLIAGTVLPLLIFEALEEPRREFDLGNPPESEHDYFDTGDWFDDDFEP